MKNIKYLWKVSEVTQNFYTRSAQCHYYVMLCKNFMRILNINNFSSTANKGAINSINIIVLQMDCNRSTTISSNRAKQKLVQCYMFFFIVRIINYLSLIVCWEICIVLKIVFNSAN